LQSLSGPCWFGKGHPTKKRKKQENMSTALVETTSAQPQATVPANELNTHKLDAFQLQALARADISVNDPTKSVSQQIKAALKAKGFKGQGLQDEYHTICRETLSPQAAAMASLAVSQGWLVEYKLGKANKEGVVNRFTVTYTRPKVAANKLTTSDVKDLMKRFCKSADDKAALLGMLEKQGAINQTKAREIEAEVIPATES
jgi:hypothetical protein